MANSPVDGVGSFTLMGVAYKRDDIFIFCLYFR